MVDAQALKKIFNSELECLQVLYINKIEPIICGKCGSSQFYNNKDFNKSYIIICTKCKTKRRVTYDSIFHNVRFGLVKAIHIYIDLKYGITKPTAQEIAELYGLTYKTSWNFKKKAEDTTKELHLLRYSKKEDLKNEINLIFFGEPHLNKVI
jgi:hypothetical protein